MAWITGSDLAVFLDRDPAVVNAAAATSRYTRCANAACTQIENYCGRIFQTTDHSEWLDGTGTKYLCLPHYPIINLYMVANDVQVAFTIANTSADADELFCAVEKDQLTLTIYGGVNKGTDTLKLSTYASMALLVAAIVALPKLWVATLQNEYNPQTLLPTATTATAIQTTCLYAADSNLWGDIEIEKDEGILYYPMGWAEGHLNYFVNWQAGYVAVPDDLTEISLQLAADLLDASERGRFLQSERTGDYSTTLRHAAGKSDGAPITAYRSDLVPYRSPRL